MEKPDLTQSSSNEKMKRAAEFKAAIMAYLNRDPTKEHSVKDVMEALKDRVSEAGYDDNNVLQHLNQMAKNKLIHKVKRGRLVSFVKIKPPKEPRESKEPAPLPLAPQELKPYTKSQKEVELVVAGVTIIVSKNPATGRPRVVIEV